LCRSPHAGWVCRKRKSRRSRPRLKTEGSKGSVSPDSRKICAEGKRVMCIFFMSSMLLPLSTRAIGTWSLIILEMDANMACDIRLFWSARSKNRMVETGLPSSHSEMVEAFSRGTIVSSHSSNGNLATFLSA